MSVSANPLTFPLSHGKYNIDVFKNPPAEYRGAPLWCWNTHLQESRLLRQIDQLSEMGFGGFHIHARIGLDTAYMGPEFMDLVKACVDRARERKMMACLYDEDRWPSGAAGGLVGKGYPEFRAQHLLVTPWEYGKAPKGHAKIGGANGKASRSELGTLISRFEISLESGSLKSYRRLAEGDPSTESTWFVYVEPNLPSEWYNGDTYVDTFNPKAIERFIETTHEVYHSKLALDFGTVVPCIFTDEPQFAHKTTLLKGMDLADIFMPWSLDMDDTFTSQYGYSVVEKLPELIWDLDRNKTHGKPLQSHYTTRYNYHDHVCERFVTSFMDKVAKWSQQRGIALIGHMMKEPTLLSQTQALGEAMRCYRSLDMPGIDMLMDTMEYNTAKQASSVARQNGAKGIMSEIYGVTNWTFDFAGHFAAGNWQAALGVVFRVHHLSWVSMAGEAKRDYPAAIGYQSPWYKEYPYVEDYFARIGTSLTRGKAFTRVAVIHPIESYWLCFGPMETSGREQLFRDQAFEDLTNWLLHGLIDFDFISESLFPNQTPLDTIINGAPLKVGECAYDVVILPNLWTIRSSTLERLQKFAFCGGTIIVAGTAPTLVDAKLPPGIPQITSSKKIEWTSFAVLSALEEWREIRVTSVDDGKSHPKFLYQQRLDGLDQHLFICNIDKKRWYQTSVDVRGEWDITILEALTGKEWELEKLSENGWTTFEWHFEPSSSVLALLKPASTTPTQRSTVRKPQQVFRNNLKVVDSVALKDIELSESNALVLDYAEYQVDDGPWQSREEILRIENIVRRSLRLPQKLEAFRQPWSIPVTSRVPQASLRLRFQVISRTDVLSPRLALEDAETIKIRVNGETVPSTGVGWWVDEDIHTVSLPSLKKGNNVIELEYQFHILTNIERVYLLGDFEVETRGSSCTLLPANLAQVDFGNWVTQGYPFYAGNFTYHCEITPSVAGEYLLEVPRFAGPVVTVDLEGVRKGTIALEPHVVDIGALDNRPYTVSITCYGNRENSFGTLHLPDGCTKWFAPNAWRSEHEWWMEGYNVKTMGILQRPQLKVKGKETYFVNRNPEKLWL